MKTISTDSLKKALSMVRPFAATHSPVESYLCIHVTETATGIEFRCASAIGTCQAGIAADMAAFGSNDSEGSIYVPLKRLSDAIQTASGEAISLAVKKTSLSIALVNGVVSIQGINVEHPDVDPGANIETCELDCDVIQEELSMMLAVSDGASLGGTYLQGGKRCSAIGDGATAVWAEPTAFSAQGDVMLLLDQAKAMLGVLHLMAEKVVTCKINHNGLLLSSPSMSCLIRTAEVGSIKKVPRQAYSFTYSPIGVVNRQQMLTAIGSCRAVCLEESRHITLSFEPDTMIIRKEHGSAGTAKIKIPMPSVTKQDGAMFDMLTMHALLSKIKSENLELLRVDMDGHMAIVAFKTGKYVAIQMAVELTE